MERERGAKRAENCSERERSSERAWQKTMVRKKGLSAEWLFCRSRSAYMLCYRAAALCASGSVLNVLGNTQLGLI
jgi:hypothetical protein